jgi:hypothetical protein
MKDLIVGAGDVHLPTALTSPRVFKDSLLCGARPIPLTVRREKSADDSTNHPGSVFFNCEISWLGSLRLAERSCAYPRAQVLPLLGRSGPPNRRSRKLLRICECR